jgi:hypothetical protein
MAGYVGSLGGGGAASSGACATSKRTKALCARQKGMGRGRGGHNNTTKNVPMQPYMAREPSRKKHRGALNNSHKKT